MTGTTALILSGGGARGAYQVGVLKGLAEVLNTKSTEDFPFEIISGTSAGALNAAFLAASSDDFTTTTEKLSFLWSKLKTDNVFETDLLSINKSILPQFFSLGKKKPTRFNSLLATEPLRELIETECDFKQIQKNIDAEKFESLIITTNNYTTGTAESFIQTSKDVQNEKSLWKESRRAAKYSKIAPEHILASSAIPVLFPPVTIKNHAYGDGCVRNNTPCSPSIRMGAEKLFVIGVRPQKNFSQENPTEVTTEHSISIIKVLNTLLNAVMLDAVEQDVYRIQRINELVEQSGVKSKSGLKKIPALVISPSQNIGLIARENAHHLPRILRMTIGAFGDLDEANEIMSYLLFESEYCRKLIEIGYHDALDSKEEILKFMEE